MGIIHPVAFLKQCRDWMTYVSKSNSIVIFLIIFLSVVIRFLGLGEKQLWIDEIIQVIHSSSHSIQEVLRGVSHDIGQAPLDHVVQHYTMKAFGKQNETAARFHAAIFGSISIALIYILAARIFKQRRIATLSAMLYAFYPLHHHYSQEGRPYSLFLMLTLILFIIYIHSRVRYSWLTIISMLVCSIMAFYTNEFAATFFVALFSINILRMILGKAQKMDFQYFIPLIFGMMGACLFIPWIVYSFGSMHGDFRHPLSLHLVPEVIQGLGDGSYLVSIMLLSLAGIGAVYLFNNSLDTLIDLSCWILVPIPLILFVLYWRSYFFAIRQLLFLTPPIVILAACGIESLLRLYGKKATVIPIFFSLLCLAVIALHFPDRRMDYRGVGQYLKQTVRGGDGIVAPISLVLISYYFPEIYSYEKRTSDGDFDCQRLFLIDTQYERGKTPLLEIQNRMMFHQKIYYKGITISIFLRK